MNAILQLGERSNFRIESQSANSLGIDARGTVTDQCHPFVEIVISPRNDLKSCSRYNRPETTGTVVPRFSRVV